MLLPGCIAPRSCPGGSVSRFLFFDPKHASSRIRYRASRFGTRARSSAHERPGPPSHVAKASTWTALTRPGMPRPLRRVETLVGVQDAAKSGAERVTAETRRFATVSPRTPRWRRLRPYGLKAWTLRSLLAKSRSACRIAWSSARVFPLRVANAPVGFTGCSGPCGKCTP
jgi:hypothetical protein